MSFSVFCGLNFHPSHLCFKAEGNAVCRRVFCHGNGHFVRAGDSADRHKHAPVYKFRYVRLMLEQLFTLHIPRTVYTLFLSQMSKEPHYDSLPFFAAEHYLSPSLKWHIKLLRKLFVHLISNKVIVLLLR